MVDRAQRLVVEPQVAHDEIDGEVVAIDLQTGTYYSLVGVAAELWSALVTGTDVDALATAVGHAFPAVSDPSALVQPFVDHLVEAGLVVETTAEGSPTVPQIAATELTELRAEAFTDMQDLMLLDPVHDVDATAGWPSVSPPPLEP